MTRRTLTVYPVDIAAVTACVATIVLAVLATSALTLAPCCSVVASVAAALSVLSYIAHRLDAIENAAYIDGVRTGVEAKRVLHLAE